MTNDLSLHAISYTISRLLCVAGLSDSLFSVSGTTAWVGAGQICFSLASREEQDAMFRGDGHPGFFQSADGKVVLPLFGWEGSQLITYEAPTLTIHADLLTVSFALLTRYEETLTERRDKLSRFSYADSLAKKYGLIQLPLVDEYAMLLRSALKTHFPSLPITVRQATITPTHDVDELWRFRNPIKGLKSIVGGDMLLRKSLSAAAHSCRQLLTGRCSPERDPLYTACLQLMADSQQAGLTSEFYFLGYPDGHPDYRYAVSHPSVSTLMARLEEGGHVVGFHGGLGTCADPTAYRNQKTRVEMAYGKAIVGGRQHYLCFDALKTPRIWAEAGMQYDTTLSFFDHEGFLCGTCHPYPLYDLTADHPLSVIERPLLLMDGTVEGYRSLTIYEALTSAHSILERVISVGGDFVIFWHNGSLERGMDRWYHNFYQAFLLSGANQIHSVQSASDCAQS